MDQYQEMTEWLYERTRSLAEFEFWRSFAGYMNNAYWQSEMEASRPPLPEVGKFSRGEVITPEDFDMLVEAVRKLQEDNL